MNAVYVAVAIYGLVMAIVGTFALGIGLDHANASRDNVGRTVEAKTYRMARDAEILSSVNPVIKVPPYGVISTEIIGATPFAIPDNQCLSASDDFDTWDGGGWKSAYFQHKANPGTWQAITVIAHDC